VMDYSASIRCCGNVLAEPLSSNGHIRHNILSLYNSVPDVTGYGLGNKR
jgi:hypothetical protein